MIEALVQPPPYKRLPKVKASLYLSEAICYDNHNVRYVDYQCGVLGIYDYKYEKGQVYSQDLALLHEIVYLMVLSRVGEMLDKRGLHRIHALDFSYKERGMLCLLPMGGGKTTLIKDVLIGAFKVILSTVLFNGKDSCAVCKKTLF